MGLDLSMLKKVKYRGSKIIAQCPACAENGHDRKGEHLFINQRGQFGCVVYPGEIGRRHRKRIFELVGKKEWKNKEFEVKKTLPLPKKRQPVLIKDILGHLGQVNSNYARKDLKSSNITEKNKGIDPDETVPKVPDSKVDSKITKNSNNIEYDDFYGF